MIGTFLIIAGIFAGIGVFLATMYSFTQVLLLEGRPRVAHFLQFVLMMTVMFSLYWWRDVETARVIALPVVGVALWTLVLEPGWYRVFSVLILVFVGLLIGGYAVLTPL